MLLFCRCWIFCLKLWTQVSCKVFVGFLLLTYFLFSFCNYCLQLSKKNTFSNNRKKKRRKRNKHFGSVFAGVRQQMCYCSHMELTVASSGCCCCCCCWCYCLFIVYRLPLQLHTHSHRQRACVCALMKTKHTHTRDTTRTQAHAHTHTSARAREIWEETEKRCIFLLLLCVLLLSIWLSSAFFPTRFSSISFSPRFAFCVSLFAFALLLSLLILLCRWIFCSSYRSFCFKVVVVVGARFSQHFAQTLFYTHTHTHGVSINKKKLYCIWLFHLFCCFWICVVVFSAPL